MHTRTWKQTTMLWCKFWSPARLERFWLKLQLSYWSWREQNFLALCSFRECHWKQWDCDKTECVQQQRSPLRQFMVSQQRAVVWPDISQQETLTHTRRGADRNLIGLLQSVTQLLADWNKEGFFSSGLYTSVTAIYTNRVNIILPNADI